MKRSHALVVVVVVAVAIAIAAISYGMTADMQSFVTAAKPLIPTFTISAQDIESAVIPDDIATANNAFAVDFYKMIKADGSDNIFFSPTSMYVAFSILYEGAMKDTAAQIQNVFGFEPDETLRHNATAHAMSSINRDDSYATLAMANALWLANDFEPYESYLDVGRGTYLADVETVDFVKPKDNPQGVKQINTWASDNTNGKIPKVIAKEAVDAMTAMVITNAIYFKGTWLTQFEPEDTEESDFWTGDSESVSADFMANTDIFGYVSSEGVQALGMPYEGDRLSMLVILPEQRDGIGALEESLTPEMIREWQQDMIPQEVMVYMPKFTMKTHYDLVPILQNMGIQDVFNEETSNLSGIAFVEPDKNLYVTGAMQAAFVNVDEEGTEAAAVTGVVVGITAVPPLPPLFVADHPFLFIIQDDESGAILFMGRVSDPTITTMTQF